MAATSLLALIDDIASILDDIAVLTKSSASKTAGVVGDDLALNAEQVAGVRAERELPVVWAVGVGSMKNKLILIPAALVISAVIPWAIVPLLMVGGLYLCYEGAEKLAHRWLHGDRQESAPSAGTPPAPVDLVAWEKDKIRGAIRTDFVLSAEIIVITLGAVAKADIATQLAVLTSIGVMMTIGVYGLVALIVKLDDAGLYLMQRSTQTVRFLGRLMLLAAPRLLRTLTVVGTAAMFLVGGGILSHGLPGAHELTRHLAAQTAALPGIGGVSYALLPTILDILFGIAAGALALLATTTLTRWRNRVPA